MIEKILKKVGVPVEFIPGQKWIAAALALGVTTALRALHVDLSVFGVTPDQVQLAVVFAAHYLWPDEPSVRL